MRPRYVTGKVLLALAFLASCEPEPAASPRATLTPVTGGLVAWLDPGNAATWKDAEKPFFLFLFSSRSYWSREMVRESFSLSEVVREINLITRPVWIDADLRPDLADRYALGGLPSLAILTSDLQWITGTTFMAREDLTALLRRIRILYDVPCRLDDLERERGRLLKRRPIKESGIFRRLSLSELCAALIDSVRQSEVGVRSSEGQLLLVEAGEEGGLADWMQKHTSLNRINSDGLFVKALLSDDGRIRDETTSLGQNAGLLYTLARLSNVTQDETLKQRAAALAWAISDCLYSDEREEFLSGTADFSFPDSSEAAQPAVAVPSLLDSRSITGWNALAVSAFCEVARFQPERQIMPAQQIMSAQLTRSDQKIAEIARRTLDRLLASRVSDDDVWRVDRAPAVLQLEDVAHLIRACLDYGDLTGEDEYYAHARVLAKHVMDRLGDIPGGTLEEMPLTHLAMVGADGDFGSAVGVFAQGLVRLFRRDGDEKYSRQAEFFCRRAIMLNVERLPRLGAVGRALWQLSEAKRSGK